jgi:hypothetical protein
MDADRWKHVEPLLQTALDLPPGEREEFLKLLPPPLKLVCLLVVSASAPTRTTRLISQISWFVCQCSE